MSELLENFSIEDLLTPTAEQSSSTIGLPDLDTSNTDLDFEFSDLPDIPDDLSIPSIDSSVSSYFDSSFNSDTGLFNNFGSSFNSFASSNMGQFAPQQFMPMYPPQYSIPTPAFGYQPPPGFMLVPAPNFYAQQPMMQPPFQMPMQNPSFSFAPAPDAPTFPSFDLDEPEPMSGVSVSTPVRRSRRTADKKTTYEDSPCPSPTPVKRQKVSRPKKVKRPAFELAAPMSVLTAASDLPIKNMLAFASRSTAVRLGEAKKAGKILRYLNSFVCYRAAYADRIKQWASQDNHQEVSRVAGASWKLEPDDVRTFYIQCAEVDKANHLKAFPSYKYDPKKKSASKKTSRSARSPSSDESDDEPTPKPNKLRQLAPCISKNDADDEMSSLFGDSLFPTPPKYNLRRRS
ncbi:hypothetical protein KCU98_g564, partial [Aureobasidium melanogenum]